MIYEGKEKERREDGIKTGKDYENEKWAVACKAANEKVEAANEKIKAFK